MKIDFSPPLIDKAVINQVMSCLESGWITTGPLNSKLKVALKPHISDKADLFLVNSWSTGLHALIKFLDFSSNEARNVIVPNITYAATALPFLLEGYEIRLCDILSPERPVMDTSKCCDLIDANTIAVIPVDYGGNLVEKTFYEHVRGKASDIKNDNLLIIQDSAHSLGAKYQDLNLSGEYSDISLYSMHAVKNVTTAEGGIVAINKDKFTDEWRSDFKRFLMNGQTKTAEEKTKGNWEYDISLIGMKCNLPDLNAAVALGQLETYPSQLKRRRDIYQEYYERLNGIKNSTIVSHSSGSSIHLVTLLVDAGRGERDRIIYLLQEKGIKCNVHYKPLSEMTAFKKSPLVNGWDNLNSLKFFNSCITLPVYPHLTKQELDYIIAGIIEVFDRVFP